MRYALRDAGGYVALDPAAFGLLLRGLRRRAGLSQNRLARLTGIDPAYVNRLERAMSPRTGTPSRAVVLGLWEVLAEVDVAEPDDRERLLVLAGHCPEPILAAGGWDGYLDRIRSGLALALGTEP